MRKFKNVTRLMLLSTFAIGLTFTSCDKDDDSSGDATVVGNWTIDNVTSDVTINTVSYVDYLIDTIGATQEYADSAFAAMKEEMNMTGTINMKDDGTYTANFGDDAPESGTWTLSTDKKTLTVQASDEDEPTILSVISLTDSKMVVEMGNEEVFDMNEDGADDSMQISMTMTFVK